MSCQGRKWRQNQRYFRPPPQAFICPKGAFYLSGDFEQAASATRGYGLGNWYYYNGEPGKAKQIFEKILKNGNRAAFGYIAAEVDLNNSP